jgi:hypothetical protein
VGLTRPEAPRRPPQQIAHLLLAFDIRFAIDRAGPGAPWQNQSGFTRINQAGAVT